MTVFTLSLSTSANIKAWLNTLPGNSTSTLSTKETVRHIWQDMYSLSVKSSVPYKLTILSLSIQLQTSFSVSLFCAYIYICVIYFTRSTGFSSVPNRSKYLQDSCLRDIVFLFSLQFQIISDTFRMYALETLFSCFLCNSKSFQISSEYVI